MAAVLSSMVVKIGVVGVGGGGCNAVDMMCEERDAFVNAENNGKYSVFNDVMIIASNTDVQALEGTRANVKIQLGPDLTRGMGAGGVPEIGRLAAEESKVSIAQSLEGLDMLFITAGMGGGTGTGAAAVVAEVARNMGILTVGIVTKPFNFEAKKKHRYAMEGMDALRKNVDTLVVIPNQRLLDIASDDDMTFDMFKKPNEVLIYAVRNLSELICNKSYVNVDFADVRETMKNMGLAMFGFGSATGEGAAINAVKEALNNPLLADFTISGSKKMLLHFGGAGTPMKEFADAVEFLSKQLHEDGDLIWGASMSESCDKVYALIVAEASEDAVSAANIAPKVKSKIEARDQGTIFDMGKEDTAKSDSGELIDDQVEVIMEELAPAAKKEEVFVIEKDKIVSASNLDDELDLHDGKNINLDDKNIPAYLRKAKNNESVIEKKVDKLVIEKTR
ncbi:MAG TPA: cell division protein FtsZ [bacterium]|nr:cell division protein FtsZ [bacterium]HPS28778.1 cell division protein FtsZ [bacterium]